MYFILILVKHPAFLRGNPHGNKYLSFMIDFFESSPEIYFYKHMMDKYLFPAHSRPESIQGCEVKKAFLCHPGLKAFFKSAMK
jgi:hypothetical protein